MPFPLPAPQQDASVTGAKVPLALRVSFQQMTTMRDCLRYKAVPAQSVVSIRKNLNRKDLSQSCVDFLTQEYLKPTIVAEEAPTKTSLFHMERLATVTRFLQLLLEEWTSEPYDGELKEWVLVLIRCVREIVCNLLKNEQQPSSDVDLFTVDCRSTFHGVVVACFALSELQILSNHYVTSHPFLLGPLWQILGKVAVAIAACSGSGKLPLPLWTGSVRALTQLLRDGLQQPPTPPPEEPLPFWHRILGFLLTRLAVFWKLQPSSHLLHNDDEELGDDENGGSATVAAAVQVLVQLRGVASASSTLSSPPDPNHNLLMVEVDKCWAAAAAATVAASQSDALIQALMMHVPAQDTGHTVTWLVQYLEQQQQLCANADDDNKSSISSPWDEERLEWMLRLVEELVFQRLPRCIEPEHDDNNDAMDLLLERSVRAMSAILWRAEVCTPCMATNLHPGRGRLHRWLVHWLAAAPMHPLSRELALLLLHRHVVGLMGLKTAAAANTTSRSNSQSAEEHAETPLLRLVVLLLLDVRTATVLRGNLAALLSRMLADPRICPWLESLVRVEYTAWERSLVALVEAKKKKKYERKGKGDRSGPPLRHSTDDWWIIISFLSEVSWLPVRRDGGSFCHHIASTSRLSTTQVQFAALYAALIDCSSSTLSSPVDQTGSYSTLLSDFFAAWNRHSNDRPCLIMLAAAVLQQALCMVRRHGSALSEADFSSTVHLVCLCTTEATAVQQPEVQNLHQSLSLEVIRVLTVVGQAITAASPKAPLQSLARCFQSLLASPIWWVRAHTMTALEQFAYSVPSAHKDVLKQCITSKPLEKWFQARLQGTLYCFGESLERLPELRNEHHAFLLETTLPQPRRHNTKIFPTSSSFTVPLGSYLLTMPTQEGRNALVIFPPGEQSLNDIRTMLGGVNQAKEGDDDDDESSSNNNPTIWTLQSVLALGSGVCKMKTSDNSYSVVGSLFK